MAEPTPGYTRRAIVAAGAALLGGCAAGPDAGSSDRLPTLVSLVVANDTSRARDYALEVRYAPDRETDPERIFGRAGSLPARQRREIGSEWPTEPGRYVVELSVAGESYASDLTERLTQEERICYRQEAAIDDGGTVSFWTDVDAPCPER